MAAIAEIQQASGPDMERVGGLTYQFYAAQRAKRGRFDSVDTQVALRGLADITGVDEQVLGIVLNRLGVAVMGLGDNDRALGLIEGKITGSTGIDWLTKEAARQVWRAR